MSRTQGPGSGMGGSGAEETGRGRGSKTHGLACDCWSLLLGEGCCRVLCPNHPCQLEACASDALGSLVLEHV